MGSKEQGIKNQIKQLSKEGKGTGGQESKLQELHQAKPTAPKEAKLVYADFTPEALSLSLASKWPSASIISSEAVLF